MGNLAYDWELIVVDDGSVDESWSTICKLAEMDRRVKALRLSRNFGHQLALTAGLEASTGDVIVSLDSDLQDPPEVITDMVKEWEKGYQIVYARRLRRNDRFFKKITAVIYYKVLSDLSDVFIPRNVGDFRLIDRMVLDALSSMREKARYIRGMVAWVGYKYTFVDFDRPERIHGDTGYTWRRMIRLAMDGILNFSMVPLRLSMILGFIMILLGIPMLIYFIGDMFINDVRYPLFKWISVVTFIFMGLLFILIWILGEYIGRIYDESRNRPLYLVSEKKNFE